MDIKSAVFPSAENFLETFDNHWRGCILMDVRMPKINGLQLQKTLQSRGNTMPIIVLTGHANVTMAITAMKQGAFDFIRKPYTDKIILNSIQGALT
ncbi:MAG: response regulator transcription factor, partial [bacterium]